jgi:nucleotide-binding universal stress UspA family protein
MVSIQHILAPTDLSDIARRAVDCSLTLARLHEAEVELTYVIEPLLAGPAAPAVEPGEAGMDSRRRERLQSALAELARPAQARGVRARPVLLEGGVVSEVLARARSWPADLVVMGTHGRGGFERWVLGSVTEKVLRRAPCPVLTVPPDAPGVPASGSTLFRRIVCPVDFSPASVGALRYGLGLAAEPGVDITVVHVLEWLVEDDTARRLAGFDVPEFRQHLLEDARERLEALVARESSLANPPRQEVVSGRTWREILRIAGEREADLVVMGVRGRNPVDLAIFGSTTNHVVRSARCPVLVIHGE